MSNGDFDKKLEAFRRAQEPRLVGRLIQDDDESVMIQAAGALFEIPTKHIAARDARGEEVELVLTRDAEVLLSTVVTVEKGFVADDVFGGLVPGVFADNCNCNCSGGNCNCNCSGGDSSELGFLNRGFSIFRRPFTGGVKREFKQ